MSSRSHSSSSSSSSFEKIADLEVELNTSFESAVEQEEVKEKELVAQSEHQESSDESEESEESSDDSEEEEDEPEEEPKPEPVIDNWLISPVTLTPAEKAEIEAEAQWEMDNYVEPTEEEKLREQLENAHMAIDEMEREEKLMAMQIWDLKQQLRVEEYKLQEQLQGEWELHRHRSIDTADFLEQRKKIDMAKGKTWQEAKLDDVVFHTAHHHIEFSNVGVKFYDTVGDMMMKFNENEMYMPQMNQVGETESQATWFAGSTLKTVKLGGVDEDVEERFVKDGKLHLVLQKNGKRCERIYKRVNEDVMVLEAKVKSMEVEAKKENEEKEQLVQKIQELEEQLEQEKKKDTTIESKLTGKFRQINNHQRILSMKLENGKFYRVAMNVEKDGDEKEPKYEVFELNKKSSDNFITTIENGKLIQKQYNDQEKVTCFRERFFEDGKLISVQSRAGEEKTERWEFERVGAPLQ